MTATKELLLTEIIELENQINEFTLQGKDSLHLRKRLIELKTSFTEKTTSVNEGTNILKG